VNTSITTRWIAALTMAAGLGTAIATGSAVASADTVSPLAGTVEDGAKPLSGMKPATRSSLSTDGLGPAMNRNVHPPVHR
jgi:hypothetical protein